MRRGTRIRWTAAMAALSLGLSACSQDAADDTASTEAGDGATDGTVAPPQEEALGDMADEGTRATGGAVAADPLTRQAPVPPRDVTFEGPGFHDFTSPEQDALSTFAMDVDTASYTVARNWINEGFRPPADAIRLEEWVNFHQYGDEPPAEGTWAITAEGGTSPLAPGRDLLRIGLHAREVADEDRPDAVLTFVVDVSGSMDRDDRLGLVKRTLSLLVDNLRPTDQVGIVVYGDTARLLLRPTPISERSQVLDAIGQLRAGGSTFAEGGIRLGYEVAEQAQVPGATNTVVLLSDGVANVGETGPDAILATIRDSVDRGIRMTAVGVGMGNFNDVLLERLANDGDGTYWYVDTEAEARRVFVDGLTGTLTPVADDAKVQVEFNAAVVSSYRQLGYVNREIADEDFRNDEVDAGELGAGHRISALWELVVDESSRPADEVATVTLRWTDPDSGEVSEADRIVTVADLRDAGPRFALARAVVAGAEVLAGSPHTDLTLRDVVELVDGLEALGPQAAEFADLMRRVVDARP